MGTKSILPLKKWVELHVHLDGAIRPQTALEYARQRGLNHLLEELEEYCKKDRAQFESFSAFLRVFSILVSPVAGDEDALRRIAYEFCEDIAQEGLLYCEVRYSPHLFANSMTDPEYTPPGSLTPALVVEVISEGISKGMEKFGIKIRTILCCMRHRPEWAEETLALCMKYRNLGVVAIDVAGAEIMDPLDPAHQHHVKIFQEAKRLGVNRTVHAGEVGPPAHVFQALEHMCVQRVGHGYATVDDDAIYKRVLEDDIHLELCPWSSFYTSSIPKSKLISLVLKLTKDQANISYSRDDPTVFKKMLTEDYDLVKSAGLTDLNIAQGNFDAARSAFLPLEEKKELIEELKKAYDEETLQKIRF